VTVSSERFNKTKGNTRVVSSAAITMRRRSKVERNNVKTLLG
jgi:hypothetical protein